MRRSLVRSTLLACAGFGLVLLGFWSEWLGHAEHPAPKPHIGGNGTAAVAWAPLPEQMNVSALLATAPR